MKFYKRISENEDHSRKLQRELCMKLGPARLVDMNVYLVVDTDELQKQVNRMENLANRERMLRSRRDWKKGASPKR